MKDVMIDLETLSTNTNGVYIQIGACFFDRDTGEIGSTFKVNVDKSIQTEVFGRHVSEATLNWWEGQGEEAQKVLHATDTIAMRDALSKLSSFVCISKPRHYGARSPKRIPFDTVEDIKVWGNGSTFDITMLETAYEQINKPTPWKFWNVRDVRTIVDISPLDRGSFEFDGVPHDGLDDAKYQAKYVSAMLIDLKKRGE